VFEIRQKLKKQTGIPRGVIFCVAWPPAFKLMKTQGES